MDKAKDDHFRYGVAIDLIGELLVGGARADWVAEAEGWLRNGGSGALGADDGFADLLAADPREEETLKTQVAACGLAVAISRYWLPVTAFRVRQELETLVAGLEALNRLALAFEFRSEPYRQEGAGTGREMALYRMVAMLAEAGMEGVRQTRLLPGGGPAWNQRGERLASGKLKPFLRTTRVRPALDRAMLGMVVKDMTRVVLSDAPLSPIPAVFGADIPTLEDKGLDGLESLRLALTFQLRSIEHLDPKFQMLPKPAMTAAIGAMCLKDAWLPERVLPVGQVSLLAGLLYRMAGWKDVEHAGVSEQPGKSEATAISMERVVKDARGPYLAIRKNPVKAPREKDAFGIREEHPVAERPQAEPKSRSAPKKPAFGRVMKADA